MAKLMVVGERATVEIVNHGDPVTAKCFGPLPIDRTPATGPCPWTETYDDLNDATEYASDHADGDR